jgi:hypothetical protein
LTGGRAVRILPGVSVIELVASILAFAVVVGVLVVLPVVAMRRASLQAPPDRDPRFVQHSDQPMPDKNYHGQGSGGGL